MWYEKMGSSLTQVFKSVELRTEGKSNRARSRIEPMTFRTAVGNSGTKKNVAVLERWPFGREVVNSRGATHRFSLKFQLSPCSNRRVGR